MLHARNRGGPVTAAAVPTSTAQEISSGESSKEMEKAGDNLKGSCGRKPSSIVEIFQSNDDNDEEKVVCANNTLFSSHAFTGRFSTLFPYHTGGREMPKTCTQRQRHRCKVHAPTKSQYHLGLQVGVHCSQNSRHIRVMILTHNTPCCFTHCSMSFTFHACR